MGELRAHWTESSTADFLYRISSDYIRQIEKAMDDAGSNQAKLATSLGVSESRVSQVLNNPGNLTLRNVIDYARALGRKVAIVAYDDNDPDNQNGPINSEVFAKCWEKLGCPADFFDLAQTERVTSTTEDTQHISLRKIPGRETSYLEIGPCGENVGFNPSPCCTDISETAITDRFDQRDFFAWQRLNR